MFQVFKSSFGAYFDGLGKYRFISIFNFLIPKWRVLDDFVSFKALSIKIRPASELYTSANYWSHKRIIFNPFAKKTLVDESSPIMHVGSRHADQIVQF